MCVCVWNVASRLEKYLSHIENETRVTKYWEYFGKYIISGSYLFPKNRIV